MEAAHNPAACRDGRAGLEGGRMLLIGLKALFGLLVGTLVGMTGLGGGVLLMPLLIFGLGVPPLTAVGSDAVVNFVTKLGAGSLHARQHTVHWRLVGSLALGSVPGAVLGVTLLGRLRDLYGSRINDLLMIWIGALLIVIPIFLLLQKQIAEGADADPAPDGRAKFLFGSALIGLLAGFLVGMTSVGSGSVIMMLLLLFYRFRPAVLVGTDIVHAVLLTGVASLMHWRLGTVDPVLVGSLLLGAIPGGLLGTRLGVHLPSGWLKRVLCVVLLATGVRMLWAR